MPLMERVVLMMPKELRDELETDMKQCGCGSVSAHVRHLLTDVLRKE